MWTVLFNLKSSILSELFCLLNGHRKEKCTPCNIKIDEGNYKEIEFSVSTVTVDWNEILILLYRRNKTIATTLMKQHMKITETLLLDKVTAIKTNSMLKIFFKKLYKRPIHIITRSPNQYSNYKTSIEIKPIDVYRRSVMIYDDMFGARNNSQIHEFFIIARLEALDVYDISKSFIGLPTQSMRNNSVWTILYNKTNREVGCMHTDNGGYDMAHCEFREMCRKASIERYNYLCIDMTKFKTKVNIVFSMKAKTHTLSARQKLKLLSFIKCFIQLKAELIWKNWTS